MKPIPVFDHPIDELLQKRWSPRAFAETALTDEQVLTLFEAARWAASCMNEQPWRFIWSRKDGSEHYNKLFDCLNPSNQEWVAYAPFLCLALTQTKFANGDANKWAGHDLGLAMGNLTTQATTMGLYVHNMGGFSRDKVLKHFQLPEGVEPMTMFVVGYMGDIANLSGFNQKREEEPRVRKPLADLFINIDE